MTSSTDVDYDGKEEPLVYEGERVKIHSRNLPLKSIISDVDDNLLNLEPEYQRDFVWDAKKCMGLLKTVFEGLPMPAVMLHERTIPGRGVLSEVVDGKQRLVTLYAYIKGDNGRFPKAPVVIRLDPDEDELAPFLDGMAFRDLSRQDQTRMLQYEVNVQSIPETTPLETVFRIYENINAGGMEHSQQQLRRAAFHGPYIKLLSRLAASDAGGKLRELAAVTEKEETEQLPEELILRFFALRRAGILSNNRRFRAPMKRFLNMELQKEGRNGRMVVWDLTDKEEEQMEVVFTNTIRLLHTLGLKDEAERALRSESGAKSKTFRKAPPVWDTTLVGLSLALDRNSNIGIYERNAAALVENYGALLRSTGWQGISNTLSHANLVKRLELFMDVVVRPAVRDDHRL